MRNIYQEEVNTERNDIQLRKNKKKKRNLLIDTVAKKMSNYAR